MDVNTAVIEDSALQTTDSSTTSPTDTTTSPNPEQQAAPGTAEEQSDTSNHAETTDTDIDTQGADPKVDGRTLEGREYKKLRNRAQTAEQKADQYEKLLLEMLARQGQSLNPNQQAPTANSPKPETNVPPERPTFEQFMDEDGNYDHDAYEHANAQYIQDLVDYKVSQTVQTIQSRQETEARTTSMIQRFDSSWNAYIKDHPEVSELSVDDILDVRHPSTQAIAQELLQSDPRVLHYLNDNPQIVDHLYTLSSPAAIAREFGKLEATAKSSFKPAPVKRVSAAPQPIKPVAPAGVPSVTPDQMDMADFMAWFRAQQI